MKPITPAQRDALQRAMKDSSGGTDKPIGRLTTGFSAPNASTLRVMQQAGWIQELQYVIDPAQRAKLIDTRDDHINKARKILNRELQLDWNYAIGELRAAQAADYELVRKSWWITEAGKLAIT